MNYSRRIAIWLLALSVQIIQACAYCGRLEMISVWLLFLKLLVGMKILTLCASVAPVSALANVCMHTGTKRNSVCCMCTVVCSVFKELWCCIVFIRHFVIDCNAFYLLAVSVLQWYKNTLRFFTNQSNFRIIYTREVRLKGIIHLHIKSKPISRSVDNKNKCLAEWHQSPFTFTE